MPVNKELQLEVRDNTLSSNSGNEVLTHVTTVLAAIAGRCCSALRYSRQAHITLDGSGGTRITSTFRLVKSFTRSIMKNIIGMDLFLLLLQ